MLLPRARSGLASACSPLRRLLAFVDFFRNESTHIEAPSRRGPRATDCQVFCLRAGSAMCALAVNRHCGIIGIDVGTHPSSPNIAGAPSRPIGHRGIVTVMHRALLHCLAKAACAFTPQSRVVDSPQGRSTPGATRRSAWKLLQARCKPAALSIDADHSFSRPLSRPAKDRRRNPGAGLGVSLSAIFPWGNWVTFTFSHDGVNGLHHYWYYTLASGLGAGVGTGSPLNVPG